MKCIYCKNGETKVYNSAATNNVVIRHRQCLSCGKKFFTEERVGENQNELNSLLNTVKGSKRKSRKEQ